MNSSWKTTLFGIMAGIGAGIVGAYVLKPDLLAGFPHWLPGLGVLLSSVGTSCLGLSARDNNKTSEQVGAGQDSVPITKLSALALAAGVGLALGLSGCTTAIKQGNIISVTSRGLGVRVVTASSSTVTPEVDLGFFSTTVVTLPTGSNVVYAPRYMNSISTKTTANPFDTAINEHLGSGDVYLGGTNDVDKAIVPTAFIPSHLAATNAAAAVNAASSAASFSPLPASTNAAAVQAARSALNDLKPQ